MPAMDKKQRKAKKREEKSKRQKARNSSLKSDENQEEERKYGAIQLGIFFAVALAGAAFIILNV